MVRQDQWFEIKSGANILAGEYDIKLGLDFSIILENKNSNLSAEVKLDTANINSSLSGPQLIKPLSSIELLYKINPRVENDLDNFNKTQKLPPESDQLKFKVKWSIASPVGNGWSN